MSSTDAAELSSLSTTLDDLIRRIGGMAGRYGTQEDVEGALRDAETALITARRRVEAAGRSLGSG